MKITEATDLTRITLRCDHQAGVLYIVPATRSWVCSDERRQDHALAGFLRELGELADQRVQLLMNQWGLSFRELPLEEVPLGGVAVSSEGTKDAAAASEASTPGA